MMIHPLPTETASQVGATHMAQIDYTDLTTAGASQTLTLGPTAAKQAWTLIFARLVTAFVSSDATLVSTTITAGDGGSATRYLASMELNSAGSVVYVKAGALAWPTGLFVYTSADNLTVAVACTALKLLTTHTAGRVVLFYLLEEGRPGQGPSVT